MLRRDIILDCPGGPHVMTEEVGGSQSVGGGVMMEAEVGVMRTCKPRKAGSLQKPEKAGK